MSKKLTIKISYGCGKTSEKTFTTRKGADNEEKRLISATALFDGHKYTSDFSFTRIK